MPEPDDEARAPAVAVDAERDALREVLAETDKGSIILAQWEAIAAADADRDRLGAERDEARATIARLQTLRDELADGRWTGEARDYVIERLDAVLGAAGGGDTDG
jgi:hypothetical protein